MAVYRSLHISAQECPIAPRNPDLEQTPSVDQYSTHTLFFNTGGCWFQGAHSCFSRLKGSRLLKMPFLGRSIMILLCQ